MEREHAASGGREWFISFEVPDQSLLLGFLRLRFNAHAHAHAHTEADAHARAQARVQPQTQAQGQAVFPELRGAALIRELHVYGVMVPTYHGDSAEGPRPQHMGLGRRLVAHAERVALKAGYAKVAIIAGVGVRRYSLSLSLALSLRI